GRPSTDVVGVRLGPFSAPAIIDAVPLELSQATPEGEVSMDAIYDGTALWSGHLVNTGYVNETYVNRVDPATGAVAARLRLSSSAPRQRSVASAWTGSTFVAAWVEDTATGTQAPFAAGFAPSAAMQVSGAQLSGVSNVLWDMRVAPAPGAALVMWK